MTRTAGHSCWANRSAFTTNGVHWWRCTACGHTWQVGAAAQPENAGLDTRAVTPGAKCRAGRYRGVPGSWSPGSRCNRPLPCPDHGTVTADA